MKRQFINILGAGALAAGMAFAQTSGATAPTNEPYTATEGAQGQAQGAHGQMMQRQLDRMTRELNLTPSQQSQARSIFSEARQEAQPIRAQLRENSQAMRSAVKAGDMSEINDLSAKQGNLIGQMAGIHNRADAKFYQTLNPEQRTKYDQLRQQSRERFRSRTQKAHPAS
ncbi:MAG TPA: Spy/CpxP family protein refolding chaperone [Bryobacteraceae bacterium]|nr:Spy/CpxP family protein refolding chaperone [Bryobacteraceae bacterium]